MSSEINLLRNQFVKLQELVTSLKNKDSFVIRFVTNETVPQTSLNRNTVYVNNDTNQFIIYDDFNNDWKYYDIGGLSFDDLSSILVAGTNITIDVDLLNETITINSTVAPTVTYIRRSDYILLDRKSYIGIAPTGSSETEAVWTIWVTVTNSSGEVISNTQYLNKKWSERNLL